MQLSKPKFRKSFILSTKNWIKCFPGKNPVNSREKSGDITASNLAVANVLMQQDDEGLQHPVAYKSRKLTAAERNNPAHVLELLAAVNRCSDTNCSMFIRPPQRRRIRRVGPGSVDGRPGRE